MAPVPNVKEISDNTLCQFERPRSNWLFSESGLGVGRDIAT